MGRVGPGALIASIITNHHSETRLLFLPSSPAHFLWGFQPVEATEGKQALGAFCIPTGRWVWLLPPDSKGMDQAATTSQRARTQGTTPPHLSLGSEKLDL